MQENSDVYVGIDFGTTQSTACYYDKQSGTIIPVLDNHGNPQYPSVLSFEPNPRKADQMVCFGSIAANKTEADYIVQEAKRFIGKKYDDLNDNDIMKSPCSVIRGDNDTILFEIPNPKTDEMMTFTPEEVIAIQLAHIKAIILTRCADCKFSRVVMSVPSSFSDEQTDKMKLAYELAEIKVVDTVKEPSAAVFEYQKLTGKTMKKTLVIDIGGGTTDVCVCTDNNGRIEVSGNCGDSELGGKDIDMVLMEMLLDKMAAEGYDTSKFIRERRDTMQRKKEKTRNIRNLKKEAERIKISLSTKKTEQVMKDTLLPKGDTIENDIQVSLAELEEKIEEIEFIDRVEDCIAKSLRKAKVKADKIEHVVLVGGVTKMPIVQRMIAKKFGAHKIAVNPDFDALTAVAKGTTRYSVMLDNLEMTGYVEKLPTNIGTDGEGGLMQLIAEKGAVTPIDWTSKVMETGKDNQEKAIVKFYKGKSRYTSSNTLIAKYEITNIPRRPKGEVKYVFNVKIERSGNMIITARQYGTNTDLQSLSVTCGFREDRGTLEEIMERISLFFP